MRRLGSLAAVSAPPVAIAPMFSRALRPDAETIAPLLRPGVPEAFRRALCVTPEKRWPRVAFRVLEDGDRVRVVVFDREALALDFEEGDLHRVAHEVRARHVAPGHVLIVLEGEAGLGVAVGDPSKFLSLTKGWK